MKEITVLSLFRLLLFPFLFVLIMWGVYWLDWTYYLQAYQYGVYPRSWSGLKGILFSPWIHGDLEHLYNNSIAVFVLLTFLNYFYRQQFSKIVISGYFLSGLGIWLFARESYHIGASGLTYVLISFLFFKGMRTKYYRLVALSLVVVVLYGQSVWYMFPDVKQGISWEGHLSGFIVGMILSYVIADPVIIDPTYKYAWQDPDYDEKNDPFMQCFDAEGNFIIITKEQKAILYRFRDTLPVVNTHFEYK